MIRNILRPKFIYMFLILINVSSPKLYKTYRSATRVEKRNRSISCEYFQFFVFRCQKVKMDRYCTAVSFLKNVLKGNSNANVNISIINLYKAHHPVEKDTRFVLDFPESIKIESRFRLMIPEARTKKRKKIERFDSSIFFNRLHQCYYISD